MRGWLEGESTVRAASARGRPNERQTVRDRTMPCAALPRTWLPSARRKDPVELATLSSNRIERHNLHIHLRRSRPLELAGPRDGECRVSCAIGVNQPLGWSPELPFLLYCCDARADSAAGAQDLARSDTIIDQERYKLRHGQGALELRVIYRQMPALRDHTFRRSFYARWGRESAVISARARLAEYPEFRQLLSIKAAFGGSEDYFVDGRRVSVDDDTYLILNNGRSYGSRIEAIRPVHSFTIFFDAHLAAQVQQALLRGDEQLLAQDADQSQAAIEFSERLFAHDRVVSPVLRYIRTAIDGGLHDEEWVREQLMFLLERMLKNHYNRLSREARVPSLKRATRLELLERIDLGIDYIYTRYADSIGLRDIAVSARLSPYHFLRTFKAVYRITPSEFLNRTRAAKALRLMQTTAWSLTTIAEHVGFGSRSSLFRQMCTIYNKTPQQIRQECANSRAEQEPLLERPIGLVQPCAPEGDRVDVHEVNDRSLLLV